MNLSSKVTENKKPSFAKLKSQIKKDLISTKQDDLLITRLNDIEDTLLSSNSLDETSKKFNLKVNKNLAKFNAAGFGSNNKKVSKTNDLDQFVQNSFNLPAGETSNLFRSKSNPVSSSIIVSTLPTIFEA